MSRRNALLGLLLAGLVVLDLLTLPGGGPSRAIGPLLRTRRGGRGGRAARGRDAAASAPPRAAWTLPSTLGYAAQGSLAEDLLTRLASLSTLDLVTEDAARHREYGVDQGTLITVRDAEGATLAALLQGGVTPDRRATYGRSPAEDRTYRLPLLAPVRLDPDWWLDARLLTFEPGLVRRVERSRASAPRPRSRPRAWGCGARPQGPGRRLLGRRAPRRAVFLSECWSPSLEQAAGR